MYFLAILHVGTIQNEGGGKFCPNSRKTYKSKNNFRPYISATPVDSSALLLGLPVLNKWQRLPVVYGLFFIELLHDNYILPRESSLPNTNLILL